MVALADSEKHDVLFTDELNGQLKCTYDLNKMIGNTEELLAKRRRSCKNAYDAQVSEAAEGAERVASV